MESIAEQNFKPQDIEIGGNAYQFVDVQNIEKGKPFYYFVKDFEQKDVIAQDGTNYGKQIVLYLADEQGFEYKISDWNFAIKQRFKVKDIIGKKISLSKWTAKKALLEVLE